VILALGLVAAPALAATTHTSKLTVDNKFVAANITTEVGDTVEFVWEGGFHNVVFDDGTSSGAPVATAGTTFARTFDTAGSFPYVCEVHLSVNMVGTVTVQAAGSGGGSGGGSGNLPLTGPEDSVLPVIGGLLLLGSIVWIIAGRRRQER